MSFLNQAILWTLFAAAIPVIIHLLNRRRHRTVKWAAMSFILKATRESRGKKKLKHILILSARTLALAALIFAVAQPLIGGLLGWGGSKLDTVVLVLDRSLSMETETGTEGLSKRQQAIQQVMQTLNEMGNPNLILVDSASGTLTEVNPIETLSQLSITAATDTKSNIPDLVEKATNYIQGNQTGQTEVWIASDLQSNDWQPESSRWDTIRTGIENLPQQPKLRILALTESQKDNASIKIINIKRRDNLLILDFEITRTDDTREALVDVSFNLNGKNSTNKEYSVNGQSITLQEEIILPRNVINGHGYLSLAPDGNNRDNTAFFAYGEATPAHTIIVSEGGTSIQFLEKAAALPGFSHQSSEVISPHQVSTSILSKASLVIWKAQLPDPEDADTLSNFIEQGGSAIFFPSDDESDNQFLDISWGEIQSAPRGQYFIISDWNQNDGPQRNYSNGESVPMETLRSIKRRTIRGDISSLADWDDSSTMLGRVIHGKGTAIFLSTLPELRWSDLEIGTISVPVIQNLLNLGNKRFGSAFFSETGRHTPLAKQEAEMIVVSDNSKVNAAFDDSDIKSTPLYLAGVKRIKERVIATNRPAEEDSWGQIDDPELAEILKGTNYSLFENSGSDDNSVTQQIWQAFLVAALLFLIIEAILCLNKKSIKLPKATTKASKA
ncbi:MAG: vWA domain-containing protein [Akkermansiaceae bacterium]